MAFDWAVAHAQIVGSALVLLVAVLLGMRGEFGRGSDMSWRSGRMTAPSDRDYDDEPGGWTVLVTCVQCGRAYEDDADERPPYRCPACCEANAQQTAQRRCTGAA